jgi:hypothetical protein
MFCLKVKGGREEEHGGGEQEVEVTQTMYARVNK